MGHNDTKINWGVLMIDKSRNLGLLGKLHTTSSSNFCYHKYLVNLLYLKESFVLIHKDVLTFELLISLSTAWKRSLLLLLLCNKDAFISKMGSWGPPIKYPQPYCSMLGTSQNRECKIQISKCLECYLDYVLICTLACADLDQ